jgi:anti-sigma28 factor (negative regulator of flagellin synthesis)
VSDWMNGLFPRKGVYIPVAVRRQRADEKTAIAIDVARGSEALRRNRDVRQHKVDKVKAEIATGTYTEEDKIEAVLDSVLDDLNL